MYSFRQLRSAFDSMEEVPSTYPFGVTITPDFWSRLREAPHLGAFADGLRQEAELAAATPIPQSGFGAFMAFERIGSRTEYDSASHDRRQRTMTLALASALFETDDYMAALEEHLWEICNEYTWSLTAHLPKGLDACRDNWVPPEQVVDLVAAMTAQTFAEIDALLQDRLSPWIRYRIRVEIERRLFHLFDDPRTFWWESSDMNWSAVCASGIGIAALLLVDDTERLAGMLGRVLRALECYLEGFGDDGGCPEGIGYWSYGMDHLTAFSEMLYERTNGQLNLLQGEKIARIARFPLAICLSGNRYVNFSDAAPVWEPNVPVLSRLALRCGQPVPEMSRIRYGKYTTVLRTLLWSDESLMNRAVPEGAFYLPDLAWVIDRRDDPSGRRIAFAARGGHNGEPHNHNDLGHFILFAGSDSLLADLGSPLYDRDFFSEKRYENLHASSLGHSVPVVNGQTQSAGSRHEARVLAFEQTPDGATWFELDLTAAYDGDTELASFVRAFHWSGGGQSDAAAVLELQDRFVFEGEANRLEELFISYHEPRLLDGAVI